MTLMCFGKLSKFITVEWNDSLMLATCVLESELLFLS